MWTKIALTVASCATLAGCSPRLQVARWKDHAGTHAATIRCSAYGQTLATELATESTITVRPPTPEEP